LPAPSGTGTPQLAYKTRRGSQLVSSHTFFLSEIELVGDHIYELVRVDGDGGNGEAKDNLHCSGYGASPCDGVPGRGD